MIELQYRYTCGQALLTGVMDEVKPYQEHYGPLHQDKEYSVFLGLNEDKISYHLMTNSITEACPMVCPA